MTPNDNGGLDRNNGHAGPEAIEHEIEETRARMQHTLTEIRNDLSPRHLVDEALAYIKDGRATGMAKSAASSVGGVLKDNPVPAAIAGIGLVWLAASSSKKRTSPEVEEGSVRRTMKERASSVKSTSVRAYEAQPLLLGLAAVGIGALIGALIPETKEERRLLHDKRDALLAKVDAVGESIVERAKGSVSQATE